MRKRAVEKKSEVLWRGAHLSLVKYPGSSYYGGMLSGTQYMPMEICMVENHAATFSYVAMIQTGVIRERLWEGGMGRRFSKAILAELIEKVKARDDGWLAELKAKEEKEIAKDEYEGELQARRELLAQAERELLETARCSCLASTSEIREAADDYRKAWEELHVLSPEEDD